MIPVSAEARGDKTMLSVTFAGFRLTDLAERSCPIRSVADVGGLRG